MAEATHPQLPEGARRAHRSQWHLGWRVFSGFCGDKPANFWLEMSSVQTYCVVTNGIRIYVLPEMAIEQVSRVHDNM